MLYSTVTRNIFWLFLTLRWFQFTFSDVANDEDSLKMPPYKVARAGHYPMVYDRVTGIPWPCDPFKESPQEKDAEKDPSFIKLEKCPEEKKTKKIKRNTNENNFKWKTWKRTLY